MTKGLEQFSDLIWCSLEGQIFDKKLLALDFLIFKICFFIWCYFISFAFLEHFFFFLELFSFGDGLGWKWEFDSVIVDQEILQSLDSLFGSILIWHFDKAITSRLPIIRSTNDCHSLNSTTSLGFWEYLFKLLFTRLEVQILDEDLAILLLCYVVFCRW